MREENSIDMYVEENGRRFLRHYLIDFGSTLGGARHPLRYSHGRESAFDVHRVFKEIASFGMYTSASEKEGRFVSPAMGIFSNDDFDPGAWKPILPVLPFENMTNDDAFWGIRVISSFRENELRRIIDTAEYTNPKDKDYLLKTLLTRRAMISRFWLSRANPVTGFRIRRDGNAMRLTFKNLLLESAGFTVYRYQLRASVRSAKTFDTRAPQIMLAPPLMESERKKESVVPLEITIWTQQDRRLSRPVCIYLERGGANGFQIVQIVR
jgi:hypothetical protein